MHYATIGNPSVGAWVVRAVTVHAPFYVATAHAIIAIVIIIITVVGESASNDQRQCPPRRLVIIPPVEMAAVAPPFPTAVAITITIPFHIAAVFLCDLDEARIAGIIGERTIYPLNFPFFGK